MTTSQNSDNAELSVLPMAENSGGKDRLASLWKTTRSKLGSFAETARSNKRVRRSIKGIIGAALLALCVNLMSATIKMPTLYDLSDGEVKKGVNSTTPEHTRQDSNMPELAPSTLPKEALPATNTPPPKPRKYTESETKEVHYFQQPFKSSDLAVEELATSPRPDLGRLQYEKPREFSSGRAQAKIAVVRKDRVETTQYVDQGLLLEHGASSTLVEDPCIGQDPDEHPACTRTVRDRLLIGATIARVDDERRQKHVGVPGW